VLSHELDPGDEGRERSRITDGQHASRGAQPCGRGWIFVWIGAWKDGRQSRETKAAAAEYFGLALHMAGT